MLERLMNYSEYIRISSLFSLFFLSGLCSRRIMLVNLAVSAFSDYGFTNLVQWLQIKQKLCLLWNIYVLTDFSNNINDLAAPDPPTYIISFLQRK